MRMLAAVGEISPSHSKCHGRGSEVIAWLQQIEMARLKDCRFRGSVT
jgi:hypothetical protein